MRSLLARLQDALRLPLQIRGKAKTIEHPMIIVRGHKAHLHRRLPSRQVDHSGLHPSQKPDETGPSPLQAAAQIDLWLPRSLGRIAGTLAASAFKASGNKLSRLDG